MTKKCPPGVFCVENYTLGILILIILGFLLYLWNTSKNVTGNGSGVNNTNNSDNLLSILSNRVDNLVSNMNMNMNTNNSNSIYTRPDSVWSTGNSVLLNPYSPPTRDDRPFVPTVASLDIRGDVGDPRGLPINIRTQGGESNYRQVGILTRITGPETILPLMGRPLIAGRDTWNFYTMSDKNNMVKLPITFKNKNCTGEYGCDNIYNGDTVYVEGYNDAFKVTMYENNTMRYIPYI